MKDLVLKGQTKEEIKALLQIVGGDEGTLLFLAEWLKNGRNATKAYLQLHPEVSYASARVLASRQLTKVNISDVFAAYGLGIEEYIKQLKAGLKATITRTEVVGRDEKGRLILKYFKEPDHKTIRLYHQALGEALGIEGKRQETKNFNQFNIGAIFEGMERDRKARGLPLT